MHSRGDHWIVAAMMLANDRVFVYDSVYCTIDQTTKSILSNLFPASTSTKLVQMNRQKGGLDCGVLAIAISTALAFLQNPALLVFDQPAMWPHLVRCLENGQFSPFPTV